MYLLFLRFMMGYRSFLQSVFKWKEFLSPSCYTNIISHFLNIFFGWELNNISKDRKIQFFQHLFSTTSTLSVLHLIQRMSATESCKYKNTSTYLPGSHQSSLFNDFTKLTLPIRIFIGRYNIFFIYLLLLFFLTVEYTISNDT